MIAKYLTFVLKKIGTEATVITNKGHGKACQRLQDLGLVQVLSPGTSSTVVVLTEAGSEHLAASL